MTSFVGAEQLWVERLTNLRNTIRQELIRRQVADHARASMTVLDVGCGQGTQALELARLGCHVTGVEPSAELRSLFETAARSQGVGVDLLAGSFDDLDRLLDDRRFDLVCVHGLLMYLDDPARVIASLARRLSPNGRLSLTFRNGHALAMRPAMRRDWVGALAAFEGNGYVNELGVTARADRLEDIVAELTRSNLELLAWYGVRVFNDAVASDAIIPDDEDLVALLDAEDQAGRRDPYRWLAAQLHVVARPT